MSPGPEKTTPPAEANPGGREAEGRPTISSESTLRAVELQEAEPLPLSPEHVAHLETSGLSRETMRLAGLYTEERPGVIARILGRSRWTHGPGIAFPYFVPGRREPVIYRIRPDRPRTVRGEDGAPKIVKYDQPSKTPVAPYFAPRSRSEGRLGDPSRPLLWTEGEKKGLILDQLGYAAIALAGVWNFTDGASELEPKDKPLHPLILEHVAIAGRAHVIVFDGDAHRNESILKAAARLASKLLELGAASVRLVIPPADGPKGIDDFFVERGEDATRALLEGGDPYDPKRPWGARKRRRRPTKAAGSTEPPAACDFVRGDDVELAETFHAELVKESPTVFAEGRLWTYSRERGIFVERERSELVRRVMRYAGRSVENGDKPPRALKLSARTIHGVIELAQDLAAERGFFDGAADGVAFVNGFVSVSPSRIKLAEHSPEHRARFAYEFEYRVGVSARLFFCALGEIFECEPPPAVVPDSYEASDAQMKIMLLQEFVGLALLGLGTLYHRAIVLLGDGANGKSLILRVLAEIFPPGSTCAIPPQEWGNEYRRAMFIGKLFNACEELPEGDIIDAESFKAISSGGEITAREIRQAPFMFRPRAAHVFAANRLPGTSDQTGGFWRRFSVVTFGRTFAEHEQDPTLAARILEAERPAIVAWALEGARRALEQGHLTDPPSSREALAQWRRGADQVREYLEERVVLHGPDAPTWKRTPAARVYSDYREWAAANGHRPMASNKFGERMRLAGAPVHRGAKGARSYPLSLLAEVGDEDTAEVWS